MMREDNVPLRVSMVQLRPGKADVEGNLATVRQLIREASGSTDVLVLPETALSGYFLEGGVAEVARSARSITESLNAPPIDAPDVVLGFYEQWRSRLYNSVVWLSPAGNSWRVQHVHRKLFLPTYGVFDEARFVESGRTVRAFDTRFGRMGMLICEEMWHSLPATILAVAGAELIVVVSASPARDFSPGSGKPGNLDRWEQLAPTQAAEHGVFVVVSQLVGTEGGKVFPGGSLAVSPTGKVLAQGPLFEEGTTKVVLDRDEVARARVESPLLADLEQMLPHLQRSLEQAHTDALVEDIPSNERSGEVDEIQPDPPPTADIPRAHRTDHPDQPDHPEIPLALDTALVEQVLVRFIRDEVVERRGFERVVIGVSGGVDSAVSLFLACKALGPENVTGFRLPYRSSSPESLDHAQLALEATGAESRTIDISEPIDRYVEEYEPDIDGMRKGNLMARLRAVILFDQSARLRALPLGTGNKSERLLGYFTWHADDSPPINPLGDLFKTQVWELARHLGVPDPIVDKPATADLVAGVTDEDEIGVGYHEADPILAALISGRSPKECVELGFPADHVDIVWRRLSTTHWKRELPTVAVLSDSAIGEFYLRPVDY